MLPKLNAVDLYTIKRIPKVLIFASLPIWLEVFLFEAEDVVFRGPNKSYYQMARSGKYTYQNLLCRNTFGSLLL